MITGLGEESVLPLFLWCLHLENTTVRSAARFPKLEIDLNPDFILDAPNSNVGGRMVPVSPALGDS